MYKEPDEIEEEEYNHPHAVRRKLEEAKLVDFLIGAATVGSFVGILLFTWVGLALRLFGYRMLDFRLFSKPLILSHSCRKRGWY